MKGNGKVRFAKALEPFLVPIDSVKPDPRNPNNGDDETVMESIRINGFVTLCTADENTGQMVAGHTRQRALRRLGSDVIPVLWEDQWDKDGAKRYLVGDNASAAKAEMDNDALLVLLEELRETEIGLAGTAITEEEYEAMLLADTIDPPLDGEGFGAGQGVNGVYQVILDFDEDPDERDRVFAILSEQYPHVRTADL